MLPFPLAVTHVLLASAPGAPAPAAGSRHPGDRAHPDDRGQTTVEYGLVILVAGTLALALIVWARETGILTGLYEGVIERLTGDI